MRCERRPRSRVDAELIARISVVLLLTVFLVQPCVAVELFGSRLSFEAGPGPRAVAVADFNADGALDLAVANWGVLGAWGSTVSILYGDGLGSFSRPSTVKLDGFSPVSLAHGDFNLDGAMDLAVANTKTEGSVSILLGDPKEGFGGTLKKALDGEPSYIATGDFDADGLPDLAVAQFALDTVRILFGDGHGDFSRSLTDVEVGQRPMAIAVDDFDHDGDDDLAVANEADDTVSILLSVGSGQFFRLPDIGVGPGPLAIASGDLDRNGTIDLAVATRGDDSVWILNGKGDGFFEVGKKPKVGGTPRNIVAADLNDDGKLDLILPEFDGFVHVLRGDGHGDFAQTLHLPLKSQPVAVAAADFGEDGAVDLAVLQSGSARVQVLPGDGLGGFPEGGTKIGVSFVQTGFIRPPGSITSGYFNGDPYEDLAVASRSGDQVTILEGDERGGFKRGAEYPAAGPVCLLPADFDGDGDTDFAVVQYADGNVRILSGRGDGQFDWAGDGVEVGVEPVHGVVGDFDANGHPDLAVVLRFGGGLKILWGEVNGKFVPESIDSCSGSDCGPSFVASADFDRNGVPDLAVVNDAPKTIGILLGTGERRFVRDREIPVGDGGHLLVASDFTGDAKPDLAVTWDRKIQVFPGDGNGHFLLLPVETAISSETLSVLTADFNNDGFADLGHLGLTSEAFTVAFTVLVGDGQGGFLQTPEFVAGARPFSATSSDFDGDGLADLAVASLVDDTVRILTNQLADRADVNGSNRIDGFDINEIGRLFSSRVNDPRYERAVDVDLDGLVGPDDLCLVAERFGEFRREASPLHATLDHPTPAEPNTVTFQPVASAGDLLTVQVLVNDNDDYVAQAAFAVTFAPEDEGAAPILEYAGFDPGTYLSGGAGPAYSLVSDVPGQVEISAFRIPTEDRVGSGLDPLLNLIFRAVGAGTVRLEFAAVPDQQRPGLFDASSAEVSGVHFGDGVDVSVDALPGGAPGQRLAVSPESLEFGPVAIGSTLRRKLRLFNRGYSVLEVTGITMFPDLPEFRSFITSAFAIPPFGFVDLFVEFSPMQAGPFSTELVIDDGPRELGRVPLIGSSQQP